MSFVHLHCHSEYSLLDGANRIDDLIKRAQHFEMPGLAITDHGNMHAAWEFQEKAKKAGIKPILGMEAYVAPGDRRQRGRPAPGVKPYYHLVLLARDLQGYKNLSKLSSLAYTEGFYTKPRIDRELLAQYSEGLIVSSACLAGEVASHLMEDRLEQAREAAAWYAELFKGRYYLEVQAHTSEGQATLNAKILSLADDLNLPVVATNDAHFLKHEDHAAHDVLLCIGLGKDHHDKDRMQYDDGLYFKSPDEIRPFFPGREDVLTNTLAIADSVDVQFEKKYYVPSFPLPEGVATENDLLVQLSTEGAKQRYGDPFRDEVRDRLEYELGVITKTGYAGYFLIVADFIKAARDRGIPVGPGRGSAAGSLVAYALGITDVCPLEFDLLFERFLNPERVSMPDVDVDFCFERRGEVIEYVRQKYGKDSVGQIVTFGTMKSRAAVKDVGRTLGFTPAETDALAKLIPNAPNFSLTVKEAIEQVPEVKQLYQSEERYKQLLDFAVKLEGLSRHTGVHAAGVVIAPGPLDEFVPICTQATKGSGSDGDERVIVTQYDMNALEKAGMLKMDFLGLTTLTVITDTIKAIKARTGKEVVLEERGFTDEKTYQVLRAGRTGGVFQFESPLATDVLKRMRCDRFDDLVASNALLRPGPLDAGMHNVYIRRKRGEEPTVYALPELEPILSNTYGVITYQEQVMRIAQVLAGISLAEADVLRKAVGKKDAELIKKELGKFKEKSIARGYDPAIIEELAGQIETFGRYGFNKCLVGDTEIYDPSTGHLVRIADVVEGRAALGSVATCDVSRLRLSSGRVIDAMDNGVKPVSRVRTESGREIVATGNHPFLMIDGWRNLDAITVGEHVAVPRRLPTGPRIIWPEHEVIALGHLLAEGNLGHPSGVYYYNQDEAAIADFITAAEQFPNVRCTRTTHKETASIYTGRVNRRDANGIFEWARGLGLLGITATSKAIPSQAFGLADTQIALLLGRMWDGDGHLNPTDRSAYYATSSKRLAQQVQHLLLRLGILGRIRSVEFPYNGGFRTGYQVFVTGVENLRPFAETVGRHLVAPAKCAAMAAMPIAPAFGGPSKDLVPVGLVRALARAAKSRRGETWAAVELGADVSSRDLYPVGTNPAKIGFTRGLVGRLAGYFEDAELQRLADNDVLWDRVVSIEPAGKQQTYDLEVADTHNFVANDCVVHNSHSVAYSVVAYHTAYLKTHYPAEFMAALLSSNIGKTEEVIKYIAEAREMGLEVLAADVNESGWRFTVVGDTRIRFGLGAIRNVGRGAIDSLLAAREKGPFTTLFDLCARVDLRLCNKRVFEALIAAGACDGLGGHRAQLTAALDTAISEAALQQEEAEKGQGSLFGDLLGGSDSPAGPVKSSAPTLPNIPPWTESDRLQREKELLGFYISGHPLEPYRTECELFATHTVAQLGTWTAEPVTIGVVVTAIRKQISKKSGNEFARLTVEDFSGSSEVLVFPEAWGVIADRVRPDVPLLLKGGYSKRDQGVENASFIVESVTRFAEVRASGELAVAIDLSGPLDLPPAVMEDVRTAVETHEGSAPLELRWRDGSGRTVRFRSRSLTVTASAAILSDLRALLGADRVRLVRAGS